jgi:tRNA-binding EMAP/Myf-like protein
MQKKILEDSINYTASVVVIDNIHPIKDADRIKLTVVHGNDVIIGSDIKIGDKMIYFVSGTKLNEQYCRYNNLLTEADLNRNKKVGYISHKKLLLKAVKLKGIVSNGLLMPLESLAFDENIYFNDLNVRDSFNTLDGIMICEKYVVLVNPNTHGSKPRDLPKSLKLTELMIDKQFRFHHQTEHLGKNLDKFKLNSHITITRKYHGSSLIISNVLVKRKLNLIEKVLNKFGINIPKVEYGFIISSGKPKSNIPKFIDSISTNWKNLGQSFYKEDIWKKSYNLYSKTIEKGITMYAEIVGDGVQGADYTYGFDFNVFVYRITMTNYDGNVYEFAWKDLKKYCEKYGLNFVDEYFDGTVKEYLNKNNILTTESTEIFEEYQYYIQQSFLQTLTKEYLNKSYQDCKVDEGICIKKSDTNEILKLKSPNFLLKEQKLLDEGVAEVES